MGRLRAPWGAPTWDSSRFSVCLSKALQRLSAKINADDFHRIVHALAAMGARRVTIQLDLQTRLKTIVQRFPDPADLSVALSELHWVEVVEKDEVAAQQRKWSMVAETVQEEEQTQEQGGQSEEQPGQQEGQLGQEEDPQQHWEDFV